MRFKAVSHKGKIRDKNEDNYYVNQELNFFMVADGMGGHAAGEVASDIAVSLAAEFDFNLSEPIESLKKLINNINQEIITKSQKNPDYSGMGTTAAAALVKDRQLYYANLGDSRIYLFDHQSGELKKISRDHSLVAELLRKGKITEAEAFDYPRKNVVTQALGLEQELDIDTGQLDLEADNLILFCTDGLTDMIRKNRIAEILNDAADLEELAEKLLAEALANGGSDNITFIIAADYDL